MKVRWGRQCYAPSMAPAPRIASRRDPATAGDGRPADPERSRTPVARTTAVPWRRPLPAPGPPAPRPLWAGRIEAHAPGILCRQAVACLVLDRSPEWLSLELIAVQLRMAGPGNLHKCSERPITLPRPTEPFLARAKFGVFTVILAKSSVCTSGSHDYHCSVKNRLITKQVMESRHGSINRVLITMTVRVSYA